MLEVEDWIEIIQDWERWKALAAKTLGEFYSQEEEEEYRTKLVFQKYLLQLYLYLEYNTYIYI